MYRTNLFVACAAVALLAFGRAGTAHAQDTLTLSFSEAQRLAAARNPDVLAEAQEVAIARAQLRQARLPAFNPELELEAPGAATLGSSETELRAIQEFEIAGQRGLRIRAAELGITRAGYAARVVARETVAAASDAYVATLTRRRRLELAEESLALTLRILRAVRILRQEGEISALESNLAEIEYGRARARVLAERREAAEAEQELRRLTGLPTGGVLRLSDDLPAPPAPGALQEEALIAQALRNRPEPAIRRAAEAEFAALGRLAQREVRPNLRVGGILSQDEGGNPQIGVVVGAPMPIRNRGQGRVAEQQARAEQARLQARAAEAHIRSQVASALRAYSTASEEAAVYEESVLAPARENRELLEVAYRAGKVGLPTLLLVRNQLLDAQLEALEAILARRRALVQLQTAVGMLPVDPSPEPASPKQS